MTQDDPSRGFSEALDELLRASGMKQETLAGELGVSTSLVSLWRSGKSRIQRGQMDMLLNLSARYGLHTNVRKGLTDWLVPDVHAVPETAEEALLILRATAGGSPRNALRLAKRFVRLPLARDVRVSREMQTIRVHMALRLRRTDEAIGAAGELEERARTAGDPESVHRARFLRAQASRNVPGLAGERMTALHEDALLSFESFHPKTPRDEWLRERANVHRDLAAAYLKAEIPEMGLVFQDRRLDSGLDVCLGYARFAVEEATDAAHRAQGLTGLARILLAAGDLTGFERVYGEVEEIDDKLREDRSERAGILRAEYLLVQGKRDEAVEVLQLPCLCEPAGRKKAPGRPPGRPARGRWVRFGCFAARPLRNRNTFRRDPCHTRRASDDR